MSANLPPTHAHILNGKGLSSHFSFLIIINYHHIISQHLRVILSLGLGKWCLGTWAVGVYNFKKKIHTLKNCGSLIFKTCRESTLVNAWRPRPPCGKSKSYMDATNI